MTADMVVGVDLGGTKIAAASADLEGNLGHRVTVPTPLEGRQHILEAIYSSIRLVTEAKGIPLSRVAGIGIISAGILDSEAGIVWESPNISDWKNVPVIAFVREEFGLPVALENDANAAALAEWQWGAGRGEKDLIYITVGTGIGGGLILDGKLYVGAGGMAGEIGHTIIDLNGPTCACGRRGCVEALASGIAIARVARERVVAGEETLLQALVPSEITAKDVKWGAVQGDRVCLEIFQQAGEALGIAIANLANLLNPAVVVLGGGVMQEPDFTTRSAEEAMRETALQRPAEHLKIRSAQLGRDVGLRGALLLGMEACGLVSLR